LNVDPGETDANFVIIPVIAGRFNITASMQTDVLVDVMGYFALEQIN
jgi:hypothetical protein